MPNILAINGSPRGWESNTDRLLQPFLAGAREAGATTEIIYVIDLKINDCRGCFTCWTITLGRCVFRDDMPAVLAKIKAADILVLGTPLYHYGMTARLKRLLERTLPLADPHIIKSGDHCTHPGRDGDFNAGMVLIANCGFPDWMHFSALEEHLRQLTKDRPERLLASILCAGGEILRHGGTAFDWYFAALHQAGREIVEQGHLSTETAATLARELVPAEMYLQILATNPLFLRTNAIITAVWGEAFLFMAAMAMGMALSPEQKPLWLVLRYLPLILAGVFTAWFPNWYPARVAAGGRKAA